MARLRRKSSRTLSIRKISDQAPEPPWVGYPYEARPPYGIVATTSPASRYYIGHRSPLRSIATQPAAVSAIALYRPCLARIRSSVKSVSDRNGPMNSFTDDAEPSKCPSLNDPLKRYPSAEQVFPWFEPRGLMQPSRAACARCPGFPGVSTPYCKRNASPPGQTGPSAWQLRCVAVLCGATHYREPQCLGSGYAVPHPCNAYTLRALSRDVRIVSTRYCRKMTSYSIASIEGQP